MNKEGYRDDTAEKAIAKASKKPEKIKCEEQFGYIFKMLRRIIKNQETIIKLLNKKAPRNQ